MMEGSYFLPLPEGLSFTDVRQEQSTLVLEVISEQSCSSCPLCRHPSPSTTHSHYRRTRRDVPCGGQAILLHLRVRRFFCRNQECSRRIFTERLPDFVEPWAQMTQRLSAALQAIGLSTSGSLGARLAARLGLPVSWMTILRCIMALPPQRVGEVLQLGSDDFAFRRGKNFGTILVDLQHRQIIDVLPDRTASTAMAWMSAHPELQLVSRDRSGDYATAAKLAASQPTQLADRFHLAKNRT